MNNLRPVDHSALSVNQATLITLLVLAFIINVPVLVVVVAVFMLVGTALSKPGFGWLYTRALRPLGVVKPDVLQDNPEPHRFAQGMGGVFVLAGFAALTAGLATLGWALVWVVVALAALNLFAGFCVGCAIYYWLGRLRVPGFVKTPPSTSRIPGWKPSHDSGRN